MVNERKKKENEGIKMIVPTLVVLFLLKLRFPRNTPISDFLCITNLEDKLARLLRHLL